MLSHSECREMERERSNDRIRELVLADEAKRQSLNEHIFQAIPDLRSESKERGVFFVCEHHPTSNSAYGPRPSEILVALPDRTREQALRFVAMIARKLQNYCHCGARETAILYGYESASHGT